MKEEVRFEFEGKDYFIRNIDSKIITQSQLVYKRAFRDAVQAGCMLRKALMKYMEKEGLWSDDKQNNYDVYIKKIADLEYKLNTGKDDDRPLKLTEARELALELSSTRMAMRDLIAEKNDLDNNTAEATAENERFNYFVAACTYDYLTKKPIFSSVEDYLNKSEEGFARRCASEFAQYYYGLQKDYDKTLTEYKFLRRFNMIDEDGNFLDSKGRRINKGGELIDEEGYRIDEEGKRIDINHNSIEAVGVETAEFENDFV
jgi:hypothetical protein